MFVCRRALFLCCSFFCQSNPDLLCSFVSQKEEIFDGLCKLFTSHLSTLLQRYGAERGEKYISGMLKFCCLLAGDVPLACNFVIELFNFVFSTCSLAVVIIEEATDILWHLSTVSIEAGTPLYASLLAATLEKNACSSLCRLQAVCLLSENITSNDKLCLECLRDEHTFSQTAEIIWRMQEAFDDEKELFSFYERIDFFASFLKHLGDSTCEEAFFIATNLILYKPRDGMTSFYEFISEKLITDDQSSSKGKLSFLHALLVTGSVEATPKIAPAILAIIEQQDCDCHEIALNILTALHGLIPFPAQLSSFLIGIFKTSKVLSLLVSACNYMFAFYGDDTKNEEFVSSGLSLAAKELLPAFGCLLSQQQNVQDDIEDAFEAQENLKAFIRYMKV